MGRELLFSVGDGQYFFDGDSLRIYEVSEGETTTEKKSDDLGFDNSRGTYLRSLALNLTNNCNLSCEYCYASQGRYDNPGAVMDFETARNSVELLIDSIRKHNGHTLTIGFFGGEPLLEFDLIEKIVNYTNRRIPSGVSPNYLLTTNGTCLRPEHVELMQQNKFHVMLSIDGDAEAHNTYRTYSNGAGTYDQVVKAAELLLENVQLEARITVTEKNTDIDRAAAHIASLGMKRITYALDYNLSQDGFERFTTSLGQLFANYRLSIARGEYFDLSNVTEPVSAIVLRKKKRAHCNAGISYLSVSAEGNLYRCPRFIGNRSFLVDNVNNTRGSTIADSIAKFKVALGEGAQTRMVDCSNCAFVYLCGGICYHHAYSVSGSQFGSVPRECVYRRQLFMHSLELICSLTVAERRGFLLYLKSFWQRERG